MEGCRRNGGPALCTLELPWASGCPLVEEKWQVHTQQPFHKYMLGSPMEKYKPPPQHTWSRMETPEASASFFCSRGCGWAAPGLT